MRLKHPEDPNRPICVNIGCDRKVHLQSRSSTGRPVYRPVCAACHKAKLNLTNNAMNIKNTAKMKIESKGLQVSSNGSAQNEVKSGGMVTVKGSLTKIN